MALHPIFIGQDVNDSEFENINGLLRKRPVPGLEHALLQRHIANLLDPIARARESRIAQEWSMSDGKGNWLTPDVMMSGTEYRLTSRGHLLIPPPPHLVIEIRSRDQHLRDLFYKARDYRGYGVPFYWIIDPIEQGCYEVDMQDSATGLRVTSETTHLSAADVRLEIAGLWEYLLAQGVI